MFQANLGVKKCGSKISVCTQKKLFNNRRSNNNSSDGSNNWILPYIYNSSVEMFICKNTRLGMGNSSGFVVIFCLDWISR